MYPIEFDLKKGTVFIPKETVEAIGSPSDVSFLYRKEDTSLLLVAGDLSSYSHKDHMRRPKSPKSGSLSRYWDGEANGYRIKGYLPTLSGIAWKFPGADGGLARGVYIVDGELTPEHRVYYDLSNAELLPSSIVKLRSIDLSKHEVIDDSFTPRKLYSSPTAFEIRSNHQPRYDETRN